MFVLLTLMTVSWRDSLVGSVTLHVMIRDNTGATESVASCSLLLWIRKPTDVVGFFVCKRCVLHIDV